MQDHFTHLLLCIVLHEWNVWSGSFISSQGYQAVLGTRELIFPRILPLRLCVRGVPRIITAEKILHTEMMAFPCFGVYTVSDELKAEC